MTGDAQMASTTESTIVRRLSRGAHGTTRRRRKASAAADPAMSVATLHAMAPLCPQKFNPRSHAAPAVHAPNVDATPHSASVGRRAAGDSRGKAIMAAAATHAAATMNDKTTGTNVREYTRTDQR